MTISRKLLLIAALACNMPFGASAHFDAVQLKDEVTTILNYIPTLHLHADNHPAEAVRNNSAKIAQWLEKKLEDTTWQTSLENFHIIALANVIKLSVQKDANIEDTITEIQNIIANKNAEYARQQLNRDNMRRRELLGVGAAVAAYIGLLGTAIYLDLQRFPRNPFTVRFTQKKPISVTVTQPAQQ